MSTTLVLHNHKLLSLDQLVHKEFKEHRVEQAALGLLAILAPLALSGLLVAWELRVAQEQPEQDKRVQQEVRAAQARLAQLEQSETLAAQALQAQVEPQVLMDLRVVQEAQGLLDPQAASE
jgi:hypothetical protein